MQEEAEKETKRREKEVSEIKKLLKKQQEDTKKEQKRCEKEEPELKKQISMKKQASMMERFLSKSKKDNKTEYSENGLLKEERNDTTQKSEAVIGTVTFSMDSAFSKGEELSLDEMWSSVIRPRNPFKMDPDLDCELDSDEEWEKEDPGKSLSDCEKDKEEELEEETPKAEEEESEDSFVVPDGSLSDDEGIESRCQLTEEETTDSNTKPDSQTEELKAFFKQQKVLHNLTEQALKKSQPLIISNLNHEKLNLLNQEGLTGIDKLEQVCMRVWPGSAAIHGLPVTQATTVEDGVVSELHGKSVTTPSASVVAIVSYSDMPEFVRLIQSCPHGLNKVVDALQEKFTSISKTQLRNKVRETSKFVDNHWEVICNRNVNQCMEWNEKRREIGKSTKAMACCPLQVEATTFREAISKVLRTRISKCCFYTDNKFWDYEGFTYQLFKD